MNNREGRFVAVEDAMKRISIPEYGGRRFVAADGSCEVDPAHWRNKMKLEHIAFNVADPVAVADWYCAHCGFRVVHHVPQPAQTHFLADEGATVIEIYCNPPDQIPDYRMQDPLIFHLALASEDPESDAQRLCGAGAEVVDDLRLADGSRLIMMRDPWGLALQLCRRPRPLLESA